jgi:hypothetical protein
VSPAPGPGPDAAGPLPGNVLQAEDAHVVAGEDYEAMWRMTAEPNSLVFTSRAPSIWRAKS